MKLELCLETTSYAKLLPETLQVSCLEHSDPIVLVVLMRFSVGRHNAPRQGAAAGRNATAEGSSNADGDMGILKAISSMGGAARRNLSLLASRFSSGQQQTRNGETGTAREFKPLVDGNGDDEDEVEFVSFDNRDQNRSRHVLQDTADTNDSENPLFQTNYSSTGASRVYQQREL